MPLTTRCLPARYYTNADILHRDRQMLLDHWQLVGHEKQLTHDITTRHFWFLFPNTVLGQFPGVPGFYASRFDPLTPDRTKRLRFSLMSSTVTDPDMERRHRLRSEWSTNIVRQEDRTLCENVQRGMQHEAFEQGWYALDPHAHGLSEHAMRRFHNLYLNTLEGP